MNPAGREFENKIDLLYGMLINTINKQPWKLTDPDSINYFETTFNSGDLMIKITPDKLTLWDWKEGNCLHEENNHERHAKLHELLRRKIGKLDEILDEILEALKNV